MSNHVTDEERLKRIKRVVEIISSTEMSFRECANFLSLHEFEISHVTVRDYMKRAKEYGIDLYDECEEIIKSHTPKTIYDEEVRTRALKVYELLEEGYTIEEIAKALDSTPMIVYRDFERIQTLPITELNQLGITEEKILEIKNNMTTKSLNNLKNRKIC